MELEASGWPFLERVLGMRPKVTPVSGDASFRHYYRVERDGENWILMEAPPDKEDSHPFVDISHFLRRFDIPVPRVLEGDFATGYFLLDDFGDMTLLKAIDAGQDPWPHYRRAVDWLLAMQSTPVDLTSIAHRRPFDRDMQRRELALFTDWYLEGILKRQISPGDRQRFDSVFHRLLDGVLQQKTGFVHRDYHSRNLMVRPDGELGIIDFQDAVMGPVTYDLASLLRDCYVAWEAPFRKQVMTYWYEGARERGLYNGEWEELQRDFDWMAVQRNLKAVGIFGRLSLRDGKHGYLNDIPRTLGYVRETLSRHAELDELAQLIALYGPTAG
ncbi:MAG: phosphotransferase [Magnetococcales bacterium]|nr:phosphotransferase [Magnetococcales bacterium]